MTTVLFFPKSNPEFFNNKNNINIGGIKNIIAILGTNPIPSASGIISSEVPITNAVITDIKKCVARRFNRVCGSSFLIQIIIKTIEAIVKVR